MLLTQVNQDTFINQVEAANVVQTVDIGCGLVQKLTDENGKQFVMISTAGERYVRIDL